MIPAKLFAHLYSCHAAILAAVRQKNPLIRMCSFARPPLDLAWREHSREGLRYPSDMTDTEWAPAAPFVPPVRRGDQRPTTDMREVLNANAMLYIAASGCAWRLLPKCFLPVSTVQRYFYAWRDAGQFDAINTVLVMNMREIEGRDASSSAGVIVNQSVGQGHRRWRNSAL